MIMDYELYIKKEFLNVLGLWENQYIYLVLFIFKINLRLVLLLVFRYCLLIILGSFCIFFFVLFELVFFIVDFINFEYCL